MVIRGLLLASCLSLVGCGEPYLKKKDGSKSESIPSPPELVLAAQNEAKVNDCVEIMAFIQGPDGYFGAALPLPSLTVEFGISGPSPDHPAGLFSDGDTGDPAVGCATSAASNSEQFNSASIFVKSPAAGKVTLWGFNSLYPSGAPINIVFK
jgi:hypothetical protein